MNDQTKLWGEMAKEYVNLWTDTGAKMWSSWYDMMGAIPTPVGDIRPELREATKRYLDNRDILVKFLQLSIDAWQDLFPKIQAGDDWQTVLNNYTEQMRQQLKTFTTTAKTGEDVQHLWSIYLQQVQKFNQLWLDPLGMSNGTIAKAFLGDTSALIEFNNLYWNRFYEEAFGNWLQAPLLGLPREINRKLLDGFEAWRALYQASTNYQIVLADIQVKSFEALMKKLIELAEKGQPVSDWRKFQDLWSVVSDEVFEAAFCKPENLKVRGQFINSLNNYRLKQQELMELYLKAMNLPLRSEVDEIHKTIYELRKEVKSLKKALAKKESMNG
jgi:class III poly(R)-hydroxyalkanoic acid synthase PhaE subunit